MPEQCPACASSDYEVVGSVDTRELAAGYRAVTVNVDVQRLLPELVGTVKLLHCRYCDLKWFTPMIEGDPAFYEALQANDWYYEDDKPEYGHAEALLKGLAAPIRLLEVGCGRGAFGVRLGGSVNYRGLEFNEQAVTKARAMGLDVVKRTIADEARDQAGAYDVVCHFQVLEHVSELRPFMQACVAALRPGGLLVTSVPADDSFVGLAPSTWLNLPPHHVTRWTDRALQNLYRTLGLDNIGLWHEPVSEGHRQWYTGILAGFGMHALLGRPVPLGQGGAPIWLADQLRRFKVLRQVLFKFGAARSGFLGRGHSVDAIGTRPRP